MKADRNNFQFKANKTEESDAAVHRLELNGIARRDGYWFGKSNGDIFHNLTDMLNIPIVTPSEALAFLQPEKEQWKPEDEVVFSDCGSEKSGKIISIFKDFAWVDVTDWDMPYSVGFNRLRRPVKTLRDELKLLLWGVNKTYDVDELTDKILALIEQRRGKG